MVMNWQRIRLAITGSVNGKELATHQASYNRQCEWQKITSTIIRDGNNRGYCYSSLIVSVITIFLIRFAGE